MTAFRHRCRLESLLEQNRQGTLSQEDVKRKTVPRGASAQRAKLSL